LNSCQRLEKFWRDNTYPGRGVDGLTGASKLVTCFQSRRYLDTNLASGIGVPKLLEHEDFLARSYDLAVRGFPDLIRSMEPATEGGVITF
jgi:hypothetical protein